MGCQCYQIGGPFIAEDPGCPAHGTTAQAEREQHEDLAARLDKMLMRGSFTHQEYRLIEEAIVALSS